METKSDKRDKVRAAFEYADLFLKEDDKYIDGEINRSIDDHDKVMRERNASENRTGLFGTIRKSIGKE